MLQHYVATGISLPVQRFLLNACLHGHAKSAASDVTIQSRQRSPGITIGPIAPYLHKAKSEGCLLGEGGFSTCVELARIW